ncbi:hypothetical protein Hanom_Chr03g00254301 [Helianthus anomalus]
MYFCKSKALNLSRYYPLAISLPSFLISRVLLGPFLHGWVYFLLNPCSYIIHHTIVYVNLCFLYRPHRLHIFAFLKTNFPNFGDDC